MDLKYETCFDQAFGGSGTMLKTSSAVVCGRLLTFVHNWGLSQHSPASQSGPLQTGLRRVVEDEIYKHVMDHLFTHGITGNCLWAP